MAPVEMTSEGEVMMTKTKRKKGRKVEVKCQSKKVYRT